KSYREITFELSGFILDPAYAQYHINEIIEQIKIIVSAKPDVRVQGYQQDPLQLETRELVHGAPQEYRGSEQESYHEAVSQWAVFDFNLRIIGPQKQKPVVPGGHTEFPNFTLIAPEEFHADAILVTTADKGGSDRAVEETLPNIWGDELTENLPFEDGFGAQSGTIAIEFSLSEDRPLPAVSLEKPLVIIPKKSAPTRSLNGDDSVTIPYGYDTETALYFPMGYQDEDGKIFITSLPAPTAGSLVEEAIHARSVSGSIRLYFKKLFRRPTNTLALHFYKDGEWVTFTERKEITTRLKEIKPERLPLIIHGILGDTRAILESLKQGPDFAGTCPVVLSYDYENLKTRVPVTAAQLVKELEEIQIGQEGIPRLTVIAHSMGGLVSHGALKRKEEINT
ncbi:MAG: alpha/beta hydrolase, partial [Leadbetterella sp.]|nr:alpha/beta hydrolase [Leadbetterella sp.]